MADTETSWNPSGELAKWERAFLGTIKNRVKQDFDTDALDPKEGLRLAYMGTGNAQMADEKFRVTRWRLRYPGGASGSGDESEVFQRVLMARPGRPAAWMLVHGALWCWGFQAGRESASDSKRDSLRDQLTGYLSNAVGDMPSFEGRPDGREDLALDIQNHIQGRLESVRDRLEAGAYAADLPPFSVEVDTEEGSAPAPRPETKETDPNPFSDGAAEILSDVFNERALRALMDADGTPAPTYQGEWGKDSTGHPVRVEQLGDPYEGRATFKVQAHGEPDPAKVEASMGWQMLDRMDMDTVWLNLLLLSYATATHRRGERPVIRIGRRTVEKVFGYTNGNYTVEERAKKIQRHVEALQSIFVQLQNVQRHGDKLHFRGDMAGGAPLWSLRMVAEGEKDLFSGETVADWYLEAREGMWATEFLHNHGNQFTPLPKDWFQQIDRRGSRNYAQRLAVYLLFQFRINSENDARVTCKAETLLNVCGEDLSAERDRHRRSELKQCLSNALDTLARDYGIKVHARQIHKDHTSGMDFNTWRNRKAVFDPPAEIEGRIFKQGDQSAPLLPEVAGDWRPDQIRHLRKEILGEAQSDFGDRLGVSKQYVSQMERGVDAPSTKIRKRLDGLQTRHA